jgi:hypothetical protein
MIDRVDFSRKGDLTMRDKKCLMILIVMILSFGLTSSLPAVNGKSNRATLKGLGGVGVLIERLPGEVEAEGLTRNQLQAAVESRLRNAGIRVLTREECQRTPGEPYLYININVNIAKTESETYPYSIDAVLIQKVSLLRDPELTTYAVTWSTGGVGSISKEILRQLADNVEGITDLFIKAYFAENPK